MASLGQRDERCVRVWWFNTEPGDQCEFELQQKLKGRWCHAACGKPAEYTYALNKLDVTVKFKLCRECLGRVIKDMVGSLSC